MNYTPAILPKDAAGLVKFLAEELPRIAEAINEKSKRLWYASAILTPAIITSDQDDYAPVGLAGAAWVRLSSNAARYITGLKNPVAASPRLLVLTNVGSYALTLSHAYSGSTAAARFAFPGAAEAVLLPGASMVIGYDITSSLWRPLSV